LATSIKLDDDLKSRVQTVASSRRRSAHWIMREAIEQYVAREESRMGFHAEAQESWDAYERDGLHLTGEETRAWLATWGTSDENDAPPTCHE
jgi:predicted transcriptional regulator